MNEALEQAAEKALVELIDVFVATKDFAIEQAPDVVRQLLAWNFAYSLVWLLIGISTCIGLLLFYKKTWRYFVSIEDWDYSAPPREICLALVVLLTGWVPICIFDVNNVLDCLKIWLAPKVWLIEYAANLVK